MKINKLDIINDREPVHKDFIDILKEKSSMVGVNSEWEKKFFSKFIRKAYVDLQESFNRRTQVILEIVSNVPEVKLIFMPTIDNIEKYKNKKRPEYVVDGITYPRSETIIIAAKGYDKEENYRKFLGLIIHECCHLAIYEIFGSFKPFYEGENEVYEIWYGLIKECQKNLKEFPIFRGIFTYEEEIWIDELAVRIPEFHVANELHKSTMQKYENITSLSLRNTYFTYVDTQFLYEAEKVASLRLVNRKTLLGNEFSKLYEDNSVSTTLFKLNLTFPRQVVKTDQTHQVLRNIFEQFHEKDNFLSTFMFIDVEFLNIDQNVKLTKKALQCRKQTVLIIDGDSIFLDKTSVQNNLCDLFKMTNNGLMVLILHEDQNFELGKENDFQKIHYETKSSTQESSPKVSSENIK